MSKSGLSSGMIKRWMLDVVILITWICSIEMWLPGYCCLSYIEDKCRCYVLAGTQNKDDNIFGKFCHLSASHVVLDKRYFSTVLSSMFELLYYLYLWGIHLRWKKDFSKVRDKNLGWIFLFQFNSGFVLTLISLFRLWIEHTAPWNLTLHIKTSAGLHKGWMKVG